MLPRRILFCADFSDNSVRAREYASVFAAEFGAELFVLHVIDSTLIGYPSLDAGVPVDIKSALDEIQHSVDKALALVSEKCSPKAPYVQTFSRFGVPSFEIVKFAGEKGIEMIVMGTHGRTGFRHLLMGSTAENVVRTANCAVLTVRSSSNSE
ncbi:MAG: universal stress protein [Desulfomonile tiedjei]|uniref:Universal stress protein n=1 Tax=Desulfomonile tiedjei TaxID=2358 RepID=A0A9D6V784_9BACT|nr:universal stress protein [Desulfomonile tiedjei]